MNSTFTMSVGDSPSSRPSRRRSTVRTAWLAAWASPVAVRELGRRRRGAGAASAGIPSPRASAGAALVAGAGPASWTAGSAGAYRRLGLRLRRGFAGCRGGSNTSRRPWAPRAWPCLRRPQPRDPLLGNAGRGRSPGRPHQLRGSRRAPGSRLPAPSTARAPSHRSHQSIRSALSLTAPPGARPTRSPSRALRARRPHDTRLVGMDVRTPPRRRPRRIRLHVTGRDRITHIRSGFGSGLGNPRRSARGIVQVPPITRSRLEPPPPGSATGLDRSDPAAVSSTSRPRLPAPRTSATGTAATCSAVPRRARARDSSVTCVSDWMSIRHPVRLAARRAFWPSLPNASDSW